MMTKSDALAVFRTTDLPLIRKYYEYDGKIDHPARREAWNDYSHALNRDGMITDKQYATWKNPF